MADPSPPIPVSASTHWLTGLVANHPKQWIWLGNAESKLLEAELANNILRAPVYIGGLARSGSTILLELLAGHQDTASHTYGDFPFLFTPCWWNSVIGLTRKKNAPLKERAHGDGILINSHSPEAMEEMLWMAFFDHLHDPSTSHILEVQTQNPDFERFYCDHIRKILHLRKAPRYLAKANYNITRMAYLHKIFPDARFIIPVRHPVAHVESLVRQHKHFTEAAQHNPRVVSQMQAGGHFEFGPHRQPIHTDDDTRMQQTLQAASAGDDSRYYALQWDAVYAFVKQQLAAQPELAARTLIVPFEENCKDPQAMLRNIHNHCDLTINESELHQLASIIRPPSSDTHFSADEIKAIEEICGETAQQYGY